VKCPWCDDADLDAEISIEHTLTQHPRIAECFVGVALSEFVSMHIAKQYDARRSR